MFSKYKFWLKAAIFFQLFTAFAHSLSFIYYSPPSNDSEKELMELMSNCKMDFGNGYKPTMENLMTSYSICFALFFALGGMINYVLLRKNVDAVLLKNIIRIETLFYGLCFLSTLIFTFLPPILCTGMIFLSLSILYFTIPKSET